VLNAVHDASAIISPGTGTVCFSTGSLD